MQHLFYTKKWDELVFRNTAKIKFIFLWEPLMGYVCLNWITILIAIMRIKYICKFTIIYQELISTIKKINIELIIFIMGSTLSYIIFISKTTKYFLFHKYLLIDILYPISCPLSLEDHCKLFFWIVVFKWFITCLLLMSLLICLNFRHQY